MSLFKIIGKEKGDAMELGARPLNFSDFKPSTFVTNKNRSVVDSKVMTQEIDALPKSMLIKMKKFSGSLEWLEDL